MRLQKIQEDEQLRAGNKLTKRHVNFDQKKMNTKLCVQVLSTSTADALAFCRTIGYEGFEECGATAEYFRVNNDVFDILNTRPFGKDEKAPLSENNKIRWLSIIKSAREYYLGLEVIHKGVMKKLHLSPYKTFVVGLIACLTSVEKIMYQMEIGVINLK